MSKYSVKRPITVLMGVLIIIVLGVFSLTKLPLTLFPEINLPYIVTITTYEGASPTEVDEEVSSKVEASVQTIGNFKEVSSMSNEHFGISIITFAESTNMDTVIIELRELINNISFKDGVGNTRILRISPEMLPVVTVTLFKSYDEELTDEEVLIRNTEWINNEIIDDLMSIPGVADIGISGAADVILQLNLDNTLLNKYLLDNNKVLEIIEEQNVGGLVGVALDNGEIRMLYLGDKVANLADIKSIPIIKEGDNVITLEDLAVDNGIKYVNSNLENYSKINNKQGIQISFQMQTNFAVTEASDNIINRLDQIVDNDKDAAYEVILNQGEYINLSISSVLNNLVIGGLLAIVILFLFLKNIKPTLIVGLAIPISVIASFMLMYFAGVSLNIVSMGGLALGIGMLVDNSIVVIENIYRLIGEGKSKKEAAIYGAKQVAGAITASTLTTIAVFFPIIFIEGMIAEVFMSMAYTIAFSLISSLFIALTLVPSMASKMLDDQKPQKEGKILKKTRDLLEKNLAFNLKHKGLVVLLVFVLLIASTGLVLSKGFEMLPESDEGNLSVSLVVDSQVEFSSKAKLADKITDELLKISDVDTVAASISANSLMSFMSFDSAGDISYSINLKSNRKTKTIKYENIIKDLIDNLDYSTIDGISKSDVTEVEVSAQNSTMNIMGATGVSIKVSGADLEKLELIATDLTNILKENQNLTKVSDGISRGADNVKVTINKENAMKYNLTSKDVNNNIDYLFGGLTSLTSTNSVIVNIDSVEYKIEVPSSAIGTIDYALLGDYVQFLSGIVLFDKTTQVLVDEYIENNPSGIYVPNMMLPGYAGEPIKFVINPFLKVIDNKIVMNPMSEEPSLASIALANLFDETANSVAEVNTITGFSTINTDGNSYFVNVTADVASGKNLTSVSSEVTKAVDEYKKSDTYKGFGRGYQIDILGENEEIISAFSDLALTSLVAILLVYMIMAIQFQSLVYPLIILITVPLAFTGGMLALLICGMKLSIVSIMGLIILVGVVVNNGIVLVDYINILVAEGKPLKEALIEAGKTRLRPILMTALTTILGLVTMALGIGEGAELLQPMAVTTIGGLLYATVLTVTIVPVIYAIFNRKKLKKEARESA